MRIPDETRSRKRKRFKLNEEIDLNEDEMQSNDETNKVDQDTMKDSELMKSEGIDESSREQMLETCENFKKKLEEVENKLKISEEQKLNIANEKAEIIAEMQNVIDALISNNESKKKEIAGFNHELTEERLRIEKLTSPIFGQVNNIVSVII